MRYFYESLISAGVATCGESAGHRMRKAKFEKTVFVECKGYFF